MTRGGAGKRLLLAVLWVAAASALVAARPWLDDVAALPPAASDVVRLHVVAHSDAEFDQAVKLRVRDRVLAVLSGSGAAGFTSRDQALASLRERAPELEAAARQALADTGADYAVRVQVGYHLYEERRYGGLVLPAGTYASVRIILGSGEGANWWCVLYPVMCSVEPLPASSPSLPGLPAAGAAADGPALATAALPPSGVVLTAGGEALLAVETGAVPGGGAHPGVVAGSDGRPSLEIRIALLEWAGRWPALDKAIQRLEAALARVQPLP